MEKFKKQPFQYIIISKTLSLMFTNSNYCVYILIVISILGASLVAQTVRNPLAMQETEIRSLGREDNAGEGNGYPFHYSCLENSIDRGAWRATIHGATKSQTRLSD